MEQVVNTLVTLLAPLVLALLLALLAAAVAAWGNAMIYAAQMIYQASINKDLVTGPDKMAWVVVQVKAYLPRLVAMVVNDNRVRSACQSIYDAIKMFAEVYLNGNKEPDNKQDTERENAEEAEAKKKEAGEAEDKEMETEEKNEEAEDTEDEE